MYLFVETSIIHFMHINYQVYPLAQLKLKILGGLRGCSSTNKYLTSFMLSKKLGVGIISCDVAEGVMSVWPLPWNILLVVLITFIA